MQALLRGPVRKPGRRIAPDVEELEDRRLLSAWGLFDSMPHVALTGGVSLTSFTAAPATAALASSQPPAALGLERLAVSLGRLPFSLLGKQSTVRSEVVARAAQPSVSRPMETVILVAVSTEPVVLIPGTIPAVLAPAPTSSVPQPRTATVSTPITSPGPIEQVIASVRVPVVFGPVQPAVTALVAPVTASAAAGEEAAATVASAGAAAASSGRTANPATATARVGEATPTFALPNAPTAVAPSGVAAAAAPVNGAAAPGAEAVSAGRVLTRAPESGGGNSPEALNWPPERGGAVPTQAGTAARTVVAEVGPVSTGWREAIDATFVEPLWDRLAGGFTTGSGERPTESAANWLDPLAAAAALGMVLGASWVGQPADVAPRRRQFFRQL
jgi:hypothetical protein